MIVNRTYVNLCLRFRTYVFSQGISVRQSDTIYARSGAEFLVETVRALPCSLGNSHQVFDLLAI